MGAIERGSQAARSLGHKHGSLGHKHGSLGHKGRTARLVRFERKRPV